LFPLRDLAKRPFRATFTATPAAPHDDDDPQHNLVPQLDFRMPATNTRHVRPESNLIARQAELGHHAQVETAARIVPHGNRDVPQSDDRDSNRRSMSAPVLPTKAADSGDQLPLDLGKLAHELRTPIGAIVALAEVMRDERFGTLGNARYKGYANDIHQSARHALAVLSAMLDAGPGPNGQADPRGQMAFEWIELNALARGCVSGLQPVAAKAGVSLRTALNPQPLHLSADRRSLKQIILNLLSNALKFTPSGGTITVASSIISGAAGALPSDGAFRIDVRDTGVGMPPELIAEVLSRDLDAIPLNGSTRIVGIGLPMARALAEAHGGHITIASAPDGTTVSVHLPRTSSREKSTPPTAS
jgi:signal transduction histidine kinase